MQPHSLTISPKHSSPQISLDIDMINNMEMSNSQSLKLKKKPTLSIDTHQVEKSDLLECQSFISSMVIDTPLSFQQTISQSPSPDKPSTALPAMDISYSLIISSLMDNPSTDVSSPLIDSSLMDNQYPLTTISSTDPQETQMQFF